MVENQYWVLKNTVVYPTFWKSRKILLSEWVGGWLDGDQKGPSILFIFEYVKKQNVLILNMVSKIVYGFYIKKYKHFNFQN